MKEAVCEGGLSLRWSWYVCYCPLMSCMYSECSDILNAHVYLQMHSVNTPPASRERPLLPQQRALDHQ